MIAGLVVAFGGCARPPRGAAEEQPGAERTAAAASRCDAWTRSALDLTQFPGRPCPWIVSAETGGDAIVVRSLGRGASSVLLRGLLPEDCRATTCAFEGWESPFGPLVLAVAGSPESELPGGVWLAVPGGERIGFVDLWAGEATPVLADSTPIGPAFTLAPFACPEGLGLFVAPRLDRTSGAEPSKELRAREGVYVMTENEPERRDADRSTCRELDIARSRE